MSKKIREHDMTQHFDLTIIGGGIIGLATALEITHRLPQVQLLIVEKEDQLAAHQTGHNSGVIHSGLYYKPGSLKAQTCVRGSCALIAFCEQHDISYERCGKIVVATSEAELPRLEELHRRGTANGVEGLEMIGPERLRELEPYTTGIKALHVPSTGIIDFPHVARTYAKLIEQQGGQIRTSHQVQTIQPSDGKMVLETSGGAIQTRFLINCGGLFSDRLARWLALNQISNCALSGRVLHNCT